MKNTTYSPGTEEIVLHVTSLGLIFILAIIGNALVIHVVRLDQRLHVPTFYFIVNLAAADVLTASAYIPMYVVSVVKQAWVFGEPFCKAHAFLISLGFNASLITLSLVSVDRYLDILSPLTYPMKMTSARMRKLLAFSWLYSIFWAGLPLVEWGEFMHDPHTHTCRPNWAADGPINKSYIICMAGFIFAIPVLIMTYCYARIFTIAKRQIKKIAKDSMSASMASIECIDIVVVQHKDIQRIRDLRAHKMILVIIVVFLLCWLPYAIVALKRLFLENPLDSYWFTNVGLTFALLNSCVNPLIYSLRDRRFKRGLKKMFCTCLKKGHQKQ